MSRFGWALPGTTSYWDKKRGQRGQGQTGGGAATWQDPNYGKGYGTRGRQGGGAEPYDERFGLGKGQRQASSGALTAWQELTNFGQGTDVDPRLVSGREDQLIQQAEQKEDQDAWIADVVQSLSGGIDRYGSILERMGQFEGPLAETTSLWQRRTDPDYKAVSDYALQPALAQQTAAGARYSRTAADQLAGRGLGRSGLSASLQGAGAGMAAQGRGMVRAGQATENATARERALQQLMRSQGLEVGLAEMMGGVEEQQNKYELAVQDLLAGVQFPEGFTYPDPYEWPLLQIGEERANEALANWEKEFGLLEQEGDEADEMSWQDWAQLFGDVGLGDFVGDLLRGAIYS